jgi:Ca2+-transporting ATPase
VYLFARAHTDTLRQAQTYAFAAWMIGHVTLAFVSRSDREPLISIGPFTNRVMDAWAVLAIGALLIAVYVPGVREAVRLAWVSPLGLLAVAGVVIAAVLALELRKVLLRPRVA